MVKKTNQKTKATVTREPVKLDETEKLKLENYQLKVVNIQSQAQQLQTAFQQLSAEQTSYLNDLIKKKCPDASYRLSPNGEQLVAVDIPKPKTDSKTKEETVKTPKEQ